MKNKSWYAYLVRCKDGSLYTGVSTDPKRRLRQHNGELARGAKALRGKRPVVLVYVSVAMMSQSAAQQEEARIKKLRHLQKSMLCQKV